MTFDEAIKCANEDSFVEEMLSDAVYLEDVIELLESLREEYEPTVEMTKKQYNIFKFYKYNLDFSACLRIFQDYNGETRMGIKFDDLKGELSDEDIMQAWLHPETIKVVDK